MQVIVWFNFATKIFFELFYATLNWTLPQPNTWNLAKYFFILNLIFFPESTIIDFVHYLFFCKFFECTIVLAFFIIDKQYFKIVKALYKLISILYNAPNQYLEFLSL